MVAGIISIMSAKKLKASTLPYMNLFVEAENKFGVDRYLLAAIMLQESGGKPEAFVDNATEVSVGLMQINIEPTEFKGKRDLVKEYFNIYHSNVESLKSWLQEPRNNVLTSAALIYDNRKKKSDNMMQDLALYNGGWNAVLSNGDVKQKIFFGYVIKVLGIRQSLLIADNKVA